MEILDSARSLLIFENAGRKITVALQQETQKEVNRIFNKDYRDKKLLTVLGTVNVMRAYYYDQDCQKGYCLKDAALDIRGSSFSPGMRRIMGRVGVYRPFGLGHEDIKKMAGIKVNAEEIERVTRK